MRKCAQFQSTSRQIAPLRFIGAKQPTDDAALCLRQGSSMYTIVCASQKGGSGKTTLSGHLAVEASRAGAGEIALIDTDPQGSLAHWWNARTAPEPRFVKAGLPDLDQAMEALRRIGIKIAVTATPAAITPSMSQLVSHADLVIVTAP